MKYIVLVSLLMLGGCASHPPVDTFCLLYKPVYTVKTERQAIREQTLTTIQTNNLKWACLCSHDKELCP